MKLEHGEKLQNGALSIQWNTGQHIGRMKLSLSTIKESSMESGSSEKRLLKMKYKPPKIEDIGLSEFLYKKGIDYDEFCRRDDLKEPDAIIARAISPDPDKPIDRRTIANWREIRKKESDAHS